MLQQVETQLTLRPKIGNHVLKTQPTEALGSRAAAHARDLPAHRTTAADSPLDQVGTKMRFSRNEEIYGDGEPAEYIYKVVKGVVRTSKILNDGRRQIGAFYLPGDIFGLEAGDDHAFSAEAVTNSEVLVIKRSTAIKLATGDGRAAKQLWIATSQEMQRAQSHVLLLIKNAQERVAGFLVEMARRAAGADRIQLPMSRQEIADYLGLTIETVSRTLTQFEKSAAIELTSCRQIEIKNRGMLSRLNS